MYNHIDKFWQKCDKNEIKTQVIIPWVWPPRWGRPFSYFFEKKMWKSSPTGRSPFLEFQRIFRNFSETRVGIPENRQFSITSHERDDMC